MKNHDINIKDIHAIEDFDALEFFNDNIVKNHSLWRAIHIVSDSSSFRHASATRMKNASLDAATWFADEGTTVALTSNAVRELACIIFTILVGRRADLQITEQKSNTPNDTMKSFVEHLNEKRVDVVEQPDFDCTLQEFERYFEYTHSIDNDHEDEWLEYLDNDAHVIWWVDKRRSYKFGDWQFVRKIRGVEYGESRFY